MRHRHRGGMTLVELLVVITIIGVLGGIVALVAPRFQEQSRVAEGSRQFTNWLNIARVRAQRDRAPRGLRIVDKLSSSIPGPNPPQQDFYHKFVYVEQPEDLTGQTSEIGVNIPLPTTAAQVAPYATQLRNQRIALQTQASNAIAAAITANPSLTVKLSPYVTQVSQTSPFGWRHLLWLPNRNLSGTVKAGDVVEFGGARYTLIIDPIGSIPNPPDCVLVLHRMRDEYRDFTNSGAQIVSNTMASPLQSFRITRSPRPIAGEPELTLPINVALDFYFPQNANGSTRSYPVNTATGPVGYFDIMYSPSGEIVGGVGASGRVIFWMRDVSLIDPGVGQMPQGENRLVVLHCRTGQVTSHPVNPTVGTNGTTLADPYSFVRDGKSSAVEDE